jgi:hypothetical protein
VGDDGIRVACPFCGEAIIATAQKCRFCGEWLSDPKTGEQRSTDPASTDLLERREAVSGRTAHNARMLKREAWALRPGERLVARSTPYMRRLIIAFLIIGLPTFGVGFGCALAVWLKYRLNRVDWVLTDQRLIAAYGWLNRRAKSVSLEKINEIHYSRALFDRLLWATGTVSVESAATAGITRLRNMKDDDPFRGRLEHQASLRRRGR